MTIDSLPVLAGNPLLDQYRRIRAQEVPDGAARDALLRRFGFAIPTEAALGSIKAASPGGVVELGAGTGYWARLLHQRGADVVAYDLFPPPAFDNRWFSGVTPWYPVARGEEAVVEQHAERTLLLIWPTRNEEWAVRAAATYHEAGGRRLVYVGEGPGGRAGDDQLHAQLGHYDRCLACAHGLSDLACICDVAQRWRLQTSVELPHWDGINDDLHVYRRLDQPVALARPRRLTSRRNETPPGHRGGEEGSGGRRWGSSSPTQRRR